MLCVDVCPARNKTETKLKAINMRTQAPLRLPERDNWNFFLGLPELDRRRVKTTQLRQQQLLRPLFEFSGACAGCGETPYLKMLTQLFGDRAVIANATGCSSIYSGNLPTTPYAKNAEGRGPTWCNSLFEDNAEFGLGFRVSLDKQKEFATELVKQLAPQLGDDFVTGIVNADQSDEAGIYEQRERVAALKEKLAKLNSPEAKLLLGLADQLVKKSVWIIGGDGWAYDIGYGGLDHVLASGHNVNVLVLDTEVYSNTGGQMSKSTPRGAVAKFAAGGKRMGKKDLGLIAMTYGHIYVASVALGAKDEQTLLARSWRRNRIPARRSSSPTAIASRTALRWTWAWAHGIKSSRWIPANGCSTGSIRAAPPPARTRYSWIHRPPGSSCRIICSRKIVSRCSPRANPKRQRSSSPRRRRTSNIAGNSMNSCPDATPSPAMASRRHPNPPPRRIIRRRIIFNGDL